MNTIIAGFELLLVGVLAGVGPLTCRGLVGAEGGGGLVGGSDIIQWRQAGAGLCLVGELAQKLSYVWRGNLYGGIDLSRN